MMFHYTVETNKSIQEAIQSLTENLKEEKYGVQWQFNIKETLHKKGFEFDHEFQVLEVCNPKEASRVLSMNQLVGYLLPCKIVVYEDDQGKTKIGLPRPSALIQMVDDDSLKEIATDIENQLIACINKSK